MKRDAIRKGFQQRREQGIKWGIKQGKNEERKEMIKRLSSKLDIDSIVDLTGLSKEEVEKYLKENF